LFCEYLKQLELTAEAIQNGWFGTGDVVRIIDGQIQIIDRTKQLVNVNVVPTTLPSRLVQPSVSMCVKSEQRQKAFEMGAELTLPHSPARAQEPTLLSGSVPPSRLVSSHTDATGDEVRTMNVPDHQFTKLDSRIDIVVKRSNACLADVEKHISQVHDEEPAQFHTSHHH
jgi:hypothetical protein